MIWPVYLPRFETCSESITVSSAKSATQDLPRKTSPFCSTSGKPHFLDPNSTCRHNRVRRGERGKFQSFPTNSTRANSIVTTRRELEFQKMGFPRGRTKWVTTCFNKREPAISKPAFRFLRSFIHRRTIRFVSFVARRFGFVVSEGT